MQQFGLRGEVGYGVTDQNTFWWHLITIAIDEINESFRALPRTPLDAVIKLMRSGAISTPIQGLIHPLTPHIITIHVDYFMSWRLNK